MVNIIYLITQLSSAIEYHLVNTYILIRSLQVTSPVTSQHSADYGESTLPYLRSRLSPPQSPAAMTDSKVPQPGPAKLKRNAGPDEWLEAAKDCKYLSEAHMKQLCEMVKEYMMEGEPQMNSPPPAFSHIF